MGQDVTQLVDGSFSTYDVLGSISFHMETRQYRDTSVISAFVRWRQEDRKLKKPLATVVV